MTTALYKKLTAYITGVLLLACCQAFGIPAAVTHTSSVSGNWSNPAIWSPAGVPASTDNVIIAAGQTIVVDANASITQLSVSSGGTLNFVAGQKLIILGTFTVNGTVTMNGGNIALLNPNTSFILGSNSSFTWDPGTNDAANATLFINGKENFAATSTLIIKKWYNYTTLPLGSVVSSNFGNLTINTNSSGTILEWNQNNQFETHQILGTLTIDQGWVTLDKSGSISNTTIGNIVLTSPNSYLTAYNGSSSPNFTLNTSSITNSGGTFFGIYDGKGNITLNVSGNFTNTGNVKLIDNDGLMGAGLCNGNVVLNVGGVFSQGAGDTRFIYNLYSSTSGTYNAKIGNLSLTGGIFMGHYSCHTAGAVSSLTVINNCVVNLANATDKFRAIGLTMISANLNNEKLNFIVGNDLTVSGNAAAEFTSNASSGDETDSIKGNVQINNGINSFDYGSSAAAHTTNLTIGGGLNINGGTTYLSRIAGNLNAAVNGNLTLSNGVLVAKGDAGSATLNVNGVFNQTGGKFYHHSNYTSPTSDVVNVIANGSFNQSGGTISFDDCASSPASHQLTINGSAYNISNIGVITSASSTFSKICFARQGTTQFSRSGSHHIVQTKQYISSGCTLNVISGNIQLASSDNVGNYFFDIQNGGTVIMNTHQLFSDAVHASSAIQVDSGGTLKTGCLQGLFDGTTSACISSNGNLTYLIDPNSVIEYNGTSNQVVTGNQKYGILRINIGGTNYAYPTASNVDVITRLDLANGELNLNGYELTVESGLTNAITRVSGYIESETNAAYNPSILTWKNVSSGAHEFPFGKDASTYIPVIFDPSAGMGGNVSISTRATLSTDNSPLPYTDASAASTVPVDIMYAQDQIIDRWWNITANGFTANVTISYSGSENTMNDSCVNGNLDVYQWNGSLWNRSGTFDTGVTSGVGTVTAKNASIFSNWMIVSQKGITSVLTPIDSSDTNADDLVISSLGPNPFTSQVSVNFWLYQDGPISIQIANLSGIIVYTEIVNDVAGTNTYTFNDPTNLAPGIYLFYMTYHGTVTTRKIIKS